MPGQSDTDRGTLRAVRRFAFSSLAVAAGCVLGEEQPPGCRADHPDDCEPGFECRAGACLRYTTEASVPDQAVSGAGGEAGTAGAGGADAALDVASDVTAGANTDAQDQDGTGE
jgi:hypothetical protein